jgi:exopolysaccharide biosynthesis polyprenyl glycosylphosphotransferase
VRTKSARRTVRVRGWMLTLPVDLVALAAPAYWVPGFWRGIVGYAVLTVLVFAAGGLYRARRHMGILDELPGLIGRLATSAAAVAVIAAQRHDSIRVAGEFMRVVAVSAGLLIVGRVLTTMVINFSRRRRWVEHGAVILGGGPIAAELARLLRDHRRYGLRVAGFLDDAGSRRPAKEYVPWMGNLDRLEQMINQTDADVILVTDVICDDNRLFDLLRRPGSIECDLYVVPRLRHLHNHAGATDHIGAIPVLRIRRPRLSGPKWGIKRAFDLLAALVGLILLSPVFILCAIAVRLEGGKGVLFRQERIGRHGRPFNVIKFRTMRPANDEESQTQWSVADDPRVGPVGRFLRRTSLDELPQLWNILRGDMTVVGPRPERPHFVEKFSAEHPEYPYRHRAPTGLTGLAQVSGLRGDTPIADRARFDSFYIQQWSLWLDIKIVLRTFTEVFAARGR